MLNRYSRYQAGLTLNDLFPTKNGVCACGCNHLLPARRKKWFSDECRDTAYIRFAIVKGDTSIIRECLYQIDQGACRSCGTITDNWEADHIISVCEGGGGFGIYNYQTLCKECHREKTFNTISYPTIAQFPHRHLQPFSIASLPKMDTLRIVV